MFRIFAAMSGAWLVIFALIVVIGAKMFEFSLFVLTGKDVPWYLDLLGGAVLNGANLPLWVFCLICKALGYEIPLLG